MNTQTNIKVWDLAVRFFHWSLAIAFIVAYISEGEPISVHIWAGYTVLSLVAFRILWGFIGTQHARFISFVFSPRVAFRYLKDSLLRRSTRYLGHNPAAGAMIILLLVSLILTTLSGVAVYGAVESLGPLATWLANGSEQQEDILKEVHEFFANFTLLLVFVHVAGVLTESLIHRENLIKSMFTGRKRLDPSQH